MSPSRSSLCSDSSQSLAHTPSSSAPNTPLLPTRPASPEIRPPHPADSNSFLTALAAQERRVLELREELQKAGEDLEKLKKQWAAYEATKKKNELQILNTSLLRSRMPCDHDSARATKEIDSRRIAPSSIKPSHRKVFAGSRHTRALSLLSPRDPGSHSDLPLGGRGPSKSHNAAANDVVVPATVPEMSSLDVEPGSEGSYEDPQKDAMLETGKQLVGDFRQGLWTFFEDFKQLTVGDEGISTASLHNPLAIAPRNMARQRNMKQKSTAHSALPARSLRVSDVARKPSRKPHVEVSVYKQEAGSSLERLTEPVRPIPTSTAYEGGNNENPSESDDDGWGNWDFSKESTPRRKKIVDSVGPMAHPRKERSSPRTSMK